MNGRLLKTNKRNINMDAKVRHKPIEIVDHVSNRFVILITNDRWILNLV